MTVPRVLFNLLAQGIGPFAAFAGKGFVPFSFGKDGKAFQHVIEEKGKPDTLAFAMFADQIHAVVPIAATHQRETMFAKFQAVLDGADTMFVKRAGFIGALRQIVVRLFIRPDSAAFQEGHAAIEHARVSDRFHIPAGRVRQPEVVVGAMRAHVYTSAIASCS